MGPATARSARAAVIVAVAAATVVIASPARAEAQFFWRGYIGTDLRLATDEDLHFARSETTAYARLTANLTPEIAAVGDVRLIFTEVTEARDFAALTDRTLLDPWRLESDALYVEVRDVGLDGLDLRAGRMIEDWGTADRFRVVSNLNPLDLEDPIAFGARIASEMVSLTYSPDAWLGDPDDPWLEEVSLQFVWVPFFKPALLPDSGGAAFTDPRVFSARANTPLIRELVAQREVLERDAGWVFTQRPIVALPERTLDNSMLGARARGRLLGVDLGLSYFRGFDDIPRATRAVADTSGVPNVLVDLTLAYPRVQVFGVDMATSLGFLDGMGLWAEVAYTAHDDLFRVVDTGPAVGVNAIEKEFAAGGFVKAVVGLDYTPIDWLYLNVQYLHGFVDEFGSGELDDYLVAGGDIKLSYDRVLIRFFNIFSLTDGSYVLYPELIIKPWSYGQISLGALIFSAAVTGYDEDEKFGSRANPPTQVFIRVSATL